MLPPPITNANSTPCLAACCVCFAMCATASMAMPRSPGWVKPSPEIFNTTRRNRGPEVSLGADGMRSLLGQFPADETLDRHAGGLGQLGDRLLAVLGLVRMNLL